MLKKIKLLRDQTGAGVVDVKKALEEAQGNEEKALEIIRKKGQAKALKKSTREVKEGIVMSYVHSNNRIGALVTLYCETDFVARNEEFKNLARDIAMHISAMNPLVLKPEDIEEKLLTKEKEIWKEQLKNEKKPEDIMQKIIAGKEKKWRESNALLTQAFIKDPEKTIQDLINEKIGKIGENIQIGQFIRYEI